MARSGCSSLPRSRRWLEIAARACPGAAEYSTGAARACPAHGAAECSTGASRASPEPQNARRVPLELAPEAQNARRVPLEPALEPQHARKVPLEPTAVRCVRFLRSKSTVFVRLLSASIEPAPGPQMARNGRSSPPRGRRWLEMAARACPGAAEYSTSAARVCPGAAECSTGAARVCPAPQNA